MSKIGIFGGTFNPIHNGHVQLAANYIKTLELDSLIVVPTKQPPHKKADNLASESIRFEMCKLAFKDFKNALVDDLEIKRAGKSYTIDTINQLQKRYTNTKFYLLLGSDMFLSFLQWKSWEEILSKVTLCTAARDTNEYDKLKSMAKCLSNYGYDTKIFDFPITPMSSTEIRCRIAAGKDCVNFLSPEVYSCIIKNNLYS